jgi:hypothetical protein
MSESKYKTVELEGSVKYIKPKELADNQFSGVILQGIYEGTIPDNFDESKNNFKFTDLNGDTVIINGTGKLAKLLSRVDEGSSVEVKYLGMEKIEKGKMAGKSAHDWTVGVEE